MPAKAAPIVVNKEKLAHPPLDIHTLGDRVLRQAAKRVATVNQEIRDLAKHMLQTMYSADGIGLAAPQVGLSKQMLVIDIDPEEASHEPLVLINPKIRRFGKGLALGQEGCLSIPGVYLDVKRPDEIEVVYKDEQGRPQKLVAEGLLSRVIQHEIDHLEGVLFVDRVENDFLLNEELVRHGFSRQAVRPV
ncbi:peptide deformylase [Lyngbya confervoides]|uniref:Peptide deformylase n=1 Tax=Lyngbya confervoides BDU141951 TaxID=1574623 RepID=A0ABD4SZ54_9CYAN|nr:peptide deformylase [Lyngbya confervoides]MCM1981342.1 peptide deformylase [Lyngbya confervoides BDU141951]